jgi:hypothetical protein
MRNFERLLRFETAGSRPARTAALAAALGVLAVGPVFATDGNDSSQSVAALKVGSRSFEIVRADDGQSHAIFADDSTGAKTTVDLPIAIENARISVHGERAVIMGQADAATQAVFSHRLGSSQLEDAFLGSQVSVSPSGRYAAFARWTPRFNDSEALQGDVYVVYDFEASAAANRVAPETAGKQSLMAGRPVYPMENFASGSHFATSEGQLRSSLYWLDGERFAFVDQRAGVHALVVVDLSAGVDNAIQREIILPVESWVKAGATKDEANRAFRSFAVTGLEVQGSGVKLTFVETDLLGSRSTWVDLGV